MNNEVQLDRDEIYDILCECNLMTIYTRDYGSLEMTDEDSIMEEFLPQVLEYINKKLENVELVMN